MKQIETFYYESLPYAYALIAIFAVIQPYKSAVTTASALVLAFCSAMVFYARYNHRLDPRSR